MKIKRLRFIRNIYILETEDGNFMSCDSISIRHRNFVVGIVDSTKDYFVAEFPEPIQVVAIDRKHIYLISNMRIIAKWIRVRKLFNKMKELICGKKVKKSKKQ